ncbi:hypothetical protein [Streptomyces zingiberis]|uniref:NIPSNAP family protein n=1 Tax=Streptomyces zingiberis TaxID=2053010 RepID=A0ABX1BYL5_9ACTN|nr:hypothetical protein [Streptomyces zingiberis]NJQ00414.1 hypothetical protein [Streptomyces zingiberis]
MYSYVLKFNLRQRGDDALDYLHRAVRTWPRLWGEIPGVNGTLLLLNALALGGQFEYHWRVDIDSLDTLSRIDRTIASGEGGWEEARREWFAHRTVAQAQVSGYPGASGRYCEERPGTDGAIHLVVSATDHRGPAERHLSRLRAADGVLSLQVLTPALGSTAVPEVWLRLEGLDSLDEVVPTTQEIGVTTVFGEVREVAGNLFLGA